MSYKIEPMPLINFLDDSNLKLPRFQRKATWDKKQNFELCISVFQDYPVGVVIINKEQETSWLLDGRQRRTALMAMRDNPVELYEWARNYIAFNKTADLREVTEAYWEKVDKFLQTEETSDRSDNENGNTENDVNNYGGDENYEENSFDSVRQRQGLKTLLDLILMVHQNKPNGSRWELNFDFSKYVNRLKYAPIKNNGKTDPKILRKFLLDFNKEYEGKITQENFVEYFGQNCVITDETAFNREVNKRWDDISNSIAIIARAEKIFFDARIGIISLTNASPLDAQNIFSRINKGGTQLKAEELLSAKPYWNKPVYGTSTQIQNSIKTLYDGLGVQIPESVVRWDIAATFIPRINKTQLVFPSYEDVKSKNQVCMEEIALGFKLLSTLFRGGMANKNVIELEKADDIDWVNDIDQKASDLEKVCDILINDTFFKCLKSWNMPIANLMGNAIALEFIAILLKDWEEKGRPQAGGDYKAVQRDARILFDRLVFEYATKVWRGSGDSKMSNDIKSWKDRLKPISSELWLKLIKDVCGGAYNGQPTTVKVLKPILYYYYLLNDKTPVNQVGVSFDVDHIMPQEKFVGNVMADQTLKDSLINLALLPKKENISKGSHTLNEITDSWLKTQITDYEGIESKDFDKFSDISNLQQLKAHREKLFKETFDKKRTTKLNN